MRCYIHIIRNSQLIQNKSIASLVSSYSYEAQSGHPGFRLRLWFRSSFSLIFNVTSYSDAELDSYPSSVSDSDSRSDVVRHSEIWLLVSEPGFLKVLGDFGRTFEFMLKLRPRSNLV